jgi:hypothetical protein
LVLLKRNSFSYFLLIILFINIILDIKKSCCVQLNNEIILLLN